jgi:hypothetical protein
LRGVGGGGAAGDARRAIEQPPHHHRAVRLQHAQRTPLPPKIGVAHNEVSQRRRAHDRHAPRLHPRPRLRLRRRAAGRSTRGLGVHSVGLGVGEASMRLHAAAVRRQERRPLVLHECLGHAAPALQVLAQAEPMQVIGGRGVHLVRVGVRVRLRVRVRVRARIGVSSQGPGQGKPVQVVVRRGVHRASEAEHGPLRVAPLLEELAEVVQRLRVRRPQPQRAAKAPAREECPPRRAGLGRNLRRHEARLGRGRGRVSSDPYSVPVH